MVRDREKWDEAEGERQEERREDNGKSNEMRKRVTLISDLPECTRAYRRVHTYTFPHTHTHKNTYKPGGCVFAQQYSVSLQAHFHHLIPGQELAIRNVHTLLCTQHLI